MSRAFDSRRGALVRSDLLWKSAPSTLLRGHCVRLRRINLDAALEMCPIFNADPRGRNIPDDRSVGLDVHAIPRVHIARHFAVYDHFARIDFGIELRASADRQSVP